MLDINEESSLNNYYWRVAEAAIALGYSVQQVRIFHADIVDAFNDGKSVEELVNEVF